MKTFLHIVGIAAMCMLVSSCEILCQAGTGTCGMSSQQAELLLHPKAYGEYWTKPDIAIDSWRQDWVACGGFSNGQFSGNAPSRSTTKVILAAQEQERKKLDACMTSKGYEYRR